MTILILKKKGEGLSLDPPWKGLTYVILQNLVEGNEVFQNTFK